MTKLKIVFFGTPDFAVKSLETLVDAGYDVAAVVTMPDKPAGRGHRMFESPVKRFAVEHDIPVLQPVKLRDEDFVQTLSEIGADLFVVIAFRMMPEVVWAMPPLGTFNLHASLLPDYRGAAPINHAIINGDTVTGVTTFFLSHDIDTGDVIDRVAVDILPDDNVGTLHDKLMELGAELTLKTVRAIDHDTLTVTPQSEIVINHKPRPAPKIFRDTCHIDWAMPAKRVHDLVRGLSPYPCAWSTLSDEGGASTDIKILATALSDRASSQKPGTVSIAGDRMFVSTADREIEILNLQPSGKKRMTAAEYLRGARLTRSQMS